MCVFVCVFLCVCVSLCVCVKNYIYIYTHILTHISAAAAAQVQPGGVLGVHPRVRFVCVCECVYVHRLHVSVFSTLIRLHLSVYTALISVYRLSVQYE